MINVILKRANGTIYWTEVFKNLQDAQKWVKEEISKKYWVQSNIVEIEDKTAEKAAEAAAILQAYNDKVALKETGAAKLLASGLTKAELNALFGTELV